MITLTTSIMSVTIIIGGFINIITSMITDVVPHRVLGAVDHLRLDLLAAAIHLITILIILMIIVIMIMISVITIIITS